MYLNKFTLFCFWTGNNAMSENRKKSLESLIKNSGLEVKLITPNNLNEFIVEPLHEGYKFLSEVHKADYLRTYFMHFHGGAYCDLKKLEKSWKSCMELFINDDNCYIMGYKEIGPQGCAEIKNDQAMTLKLKQNWTSLIGNGAYICKPLTVFSHEWYNQLLTKMDENLDQLKKFPSKEPRQVYSKAYPYPFMWTEILGQIFHPLLLKYKEKVRNDLPPPLFTKYL